MHGCEQTEVEIKPSHLHVPPSQFGGLESKVWAAPGQYLVRQPISFVGRGCEHQRPDGFEREATLDVHAIGTTQKEHSCGEPLYSYSYRLSENHFATVLYALIVWFIEP